MSDCGTTRRLLPSVRRLRFSLRTLLIAVTAVSLFLGIVYERVRNEQRAADAVAAARGHVVYDWQVRPEGADRSFEPQPWGPEWLRRLVGPHWLDSVEEVRLDGHRRHLPEGDFAAVGPHLARLPRLRSLILREGDFGVADCELIERMPALEELTLTVESAITPEVAAALAKSRALRELVILQAKVSPEALAELAAMPNLESLRVTGAANGYDRATGEARTDFYLRDEHAEAIANFPALRKLSLHDTVVTDAGVEALCRLGRLEWLCVSSPEVTSASFEHVATLERLEYLGAWQWKVDGADFVKLTALPSLSSMDLITRMSDESVAHLAVLPDLEGLAVSGDKVTERSVPLFCEMKKLEWLNLQSTGIYKEGEAAKRLIESLPNCRIRLPKTQEERRADAVFYGSRLRFGGSE